MRVLAFGTYDIAAHPRVAVLIEGLREAGFVVDECNVPLGLSTAERVQILSKPSRLPVLAVRIARCWFSLRRRARTFPAPDAVLVGYLGHFDVHLARALFPEARIVLDHLIGAYDTARDRGLGGGLKGRLLRKLDTSALSKADVIVVDTVEHRSQLPDEVQSRAVTVAVGAPRAWFAAARDRADDHGADRLRVVFFGLYTPLQGVPVIASALAKLAGSPIDFTMIGTGQDYATARTIAASNTTIRWLDWIPSARLPEVVANHDVCLGIFGEGPKALRVVPNKVFQGAAAGCAIVTSATQPQQRIFGDAAAYVPPGDAAELAGTLGRLAEDRKELHRLRDAAHDLAGRNFGARQVVAPLVGMLADR